MAIETLLFDLDNTLIDRPSTMFGLTQRLVEHFRDQTEVLDIQVLNRQIQYLDQGGYGVKDDSFWQELLALFPWLGTPPSCADFRDLWYEFYWDATEPMPGLFETLADLEAMSLKLGIITNGRTIGQNVKIERLGIRKRMQTIIVSETVDIRKPDSGIFQLALSEIGSDPAHSCFIGDNPIADVVGSRAAGLYAIWMRGYFEWPGDHPQPKICIDALPELVPLMQRRFRP